MEIERSPTGDVGPVDGNGPARGTGKPAVTVDRTDSEAVRAVLDRAAVVLAMHNARDGMCGGCIQVWARLVPFPCSQRQWAVGVVERYGGTLTSATAQKSEP